MNRIYPLLFLSVVTLNISCQTQIGFDYYGYFTDETYFTSSNDINSNSGIISWRNFNLAAESVEDRDKLIVDITDYLKGARVNPLKPAISDMDDSEEWTNEIIRLRDDVLHLDYEKNQKALLGFIIEEPFTHSSSAAKYFNNYKAGYMDYENLFFVVKGNYLGKGNLDEIACIYRKPDRGTTIKVIESNGTALNDMIIWYDDSNFLSANIRFALSGDFNGNGSEELALIYEDLYGFSVYLLSFTGMQFSENNLRKMFSAERSIYNLDDVKFAISGNFDGQNSDEIALFRAANNYNYIDMIKPNHTSVNQWYSEKINPGWNFSNIHGISSGNFDGLFDTDEISVLYHDKQSSRSVIEVLSGHPENFPVKFGDREVWYEKSTNVIDFQNVHSFHSGDFNYDGKEDLVIFHESDYDQILRMKSDPDNDDPSKRFRDDWISRRSFVNESYQSDWQFKNLNFSVAGNFYNNKNHKDHRLRDDTWSEHGIDDIMLFYEDQVFCDYTKPHIDFSSKERLAYVRERIKKVFEIRVPGIKTMILYGGRSTYIPDVFEESFDWVGTDIYPFIQGKSAPYTEGYFEILNATQNIINSISNDVFLVGQCSESFAQGYNELRYPDNTETDYYIKIAKSSSRIIALFWWRYQSKDSWKGAESNSELLRKHKFLDDF